MAVGDLIGKTINELTIIDEYRKNGRTYCKVKCSCGEQFETRKDSITSERTKSCGHLTQFENKDLAGQTFGRLKAIREVGKSKEGRYLWECQCECGNTITIESTSLIIGRASSCGCYARDVAIEIFESTEEAKKEKYYKEGTYIPGLNDTIPSHNTSGVKGVYYDTTREKWVAVLEFQGEIKLLKRFNEKTDAIKARKDAEEEYFKPIIEKYKKK